MSFSSINTFCRIGSGAWHRVFAHTADGLEVAEHAISFIEAWETAPHPPPRPDDRLMRLRWEDLSVPLPELPGPAWAWALTYPAHQKEARLADAFAFQKHGQAREAWAPIHHRPALDYEAELAILLHRHAPDQFGFLFANDLTDRSIQVLKFDRHWPAPGFTAAKSFPGALRVGPLLAISTSDSWPKLEARLEVNGTLRQHVKARECILGPLQFHRHVFSQRNVDDWMLVLTGTAEGTIFQTPAPAQRLELLFKNGFSARRAKEALLGSFQFLRVGDRLSIQSEILGTSHAMVVESAA